MEDKDDDCLQQYLEYENAVLEQYLKFKDNEVIAVTGSIDIVFDFADRVILNVGGTKFETFKKVLKKIPATRLSRLTEALANYDPAKNEYFFDRHPGVFPQILSYYNSGKLHYPTNVCGPLFEEELAFWGIDMNQVEPCCWKTYNEHRATEETLAALDRLEMDVDRTSKDDLIIKFCIEEDNSGKIPWFKRFQPVVWQLFEEPRSSPAAKNIAKFHKAVIVFSAMMLWIKAFVSSWYDSVLIREENSNETFSIRILNYEILYYTLYFDYVTIAWFTFECTLRFLVAPSPSIFFRKMDNWIDCIATVWFYIDALISIFFHHPLMDLIEAVRMLRLIHIFAYTIGLKVIISSLMESASILRLLCAIMGIASTIFGCLVFYADKLTGDPTTENKIISAVEGIWYALVSLTTIGYGDFAPTSFLGRFFGGLCVLAGVIMIGLPMTIIVEIFSNMTNHLRARSKLPKQRRRILPVEAPRVRKKAATQQPANKVEPMP